MKLPTAPEASHRADSSHLFVARRALFAVVGVLIVISVTMIGSLSYVAWQLNRHEFQHSQHMVEQVWRSRLKSIISSTRDNAFWGDAYQHLHIDTDSDWAFVRGNLGASLYTDFQFEGVFVVGPDDRTRYAVIGGELADRQLESWLGALPKRLIQQARDGAADEQAFTQVQPMGEHPVLLSAAALTPGENPDVEMTDDPQSVLILAYRLTPLKLDQIGTDYDIANLRTPLDGADAVAAPAVRAGELVLRWDPERPGDKLINGLLPVLLLLLAALAVGTFVVFRKSFHTARLMDKQLLAITAGQAALLHQSRHDALTGLPNRTHMQTFLQAELQRLPTREAPVVMLSLDLDNFKAINDVFGHSGGDSVLREVALRLQGCIARQDLLVRHGGDEFILITTSLLDMPAIHGLCRQLIQRIAEPFTVNGQDVFIGLSIGIALCPADACASCELLKFSDLALYEAKKAGRNTWRFYEQAMTTRITERRELEKDLRAAIGADQFTLRYQPRYHISSGRIAGAEALIRWEHPTRGLCMPDRFIGLAEENGSIIALSDWVMHRACSDAVRWEDSLIVSVNISAVEFRTPGLVERVRNVLAATGLPSRRLELEVTERVMIDDAEAGLNVMTALKALGVRLSMDDFGTGYSSLSYLKSFPFDGLKIDRSFINEIEDSAQSQSIVQAIIQLGRSLSLTITAEGVETARQLAYLKSFDCDEAQGYLLSKPMPLEAFVQAMAAQEVQATAGTA
ncbi:EAL domain-containing protein [Pseudomonas sp. v388]|uniref:putative bifunctional diguanylate cyclase/phosphodiesterase n=1 Tax=Pseudomonas sp. v388 TaxID=2479849 RepID=UPI000F7833F7|nr:EAL domain-containing protein [Pseudomonas sp. v388]RRV05335.1 EAL domain-containing protein [Pseudomonas sp. v388]